VPAGEENTVKNYTEDNGLADIKLLAVDMDLTLLASDGSLPPHMDERIDALAEAGVAIEDITPQTIPHDFERNAKIHCCYLVRKA